MNLDIGGIILGDVDGADKIFRVLIRGRQRAQGKTGHVTIETMVKKMCFDDERRDHCQRC